MDELVAGVDAMSREALCEALRLLRGSTGALAGGWSGAAAVGWRL